jgi:hypothetical protein
VLRCSVLLSGTNYCDWVPLMRLHMHGLGLWESDLWVLMRLTSYESQFRVYQTWLDEDALTDSFLAVSMEDCFVADIVELDQAHQMWTFLKDRYDL